MDSGCKLSEEVFEIQRDTTGRSCGMNRSRDSNQQLMKPVYWIIQHVRPGNEVTKVRKTTAARISPGGAGARECSVYDVVCTIPIARGLDGLFCDPVDWLVS